MSYHGDFAHGTYENSKSGPIISNHPTTQVFLLKSLEKFGRGQTLGTRRSPFNSATFFCCCWYFCSLLSFFCSHRIFSNCFFFNRMPCGKISKTFLIPSSRATLYKGAALGDVARLEAFGAADFGVAQWEADEAVAKPRTLAMHRATALSSQSTGWGFGEFVCFFFLGGGRIGGKGVVVRSLFLFFRPFF